MTAGLSEPEMMRAFLEGDAGYDESFWTAVRTTGIFCRPSCRARKPRPENVEFFESVRAAVFAGYRPCKRCRPLHAPSQRPAWMDRLLAEVERHPDRRITADELRAKGLNPATVRRAFVGRYAPTVEPGACTERSTRSGRVADSMTSCGRAATLTARFERPLVEPSAPPRFAPGRASASPCRGSRPRSDR